MKKGVRVGRQHDALGDLATIGGRFAKLAQSVGGR